MSGSTTLTDELLAIIAERPGSTAGELYNLSTIAIKRDQVYQAVWSLKTTGRVQKVGKGYRITDKGRATAPKLADLGWSETNSKPRGSAPAESSDSCSTKPPADPDSPLLTGTGSASPPGGLIRPIGAGGGGRNGGALFAEFLDALISACREDSNPALRELASRVEKHKPAGLG